MPPAPLSRAILTQVWVKGEACIEASGGLVQVSREMEYRAARNQDALDFGEHLWREQSPDSSRLRARVVVSVRRRDRERQPLMCDCGGNIRGGLLAPAFCAGGAHGPPVLCVRVAAPQGRVECVPRPQLHLAGQPQRSHASARKDAMSACIGAQHAGHGCEWCPDVEEDSRVVARVAPGEGEAQGRPEKGCRAGGLSLVPAACGAGEGRGCTLARRPFGASPHMLWW